MKVFIIAVVIFYFYLRKQITCLSNIKKTGIILKKYDAYYEAPDSKKEQAYLELVREKPLTDDLLGTYFSGAPSYRDFSDEGKIRQFHAMLLEFIDQNIYDFKKYFHPKYFLLDIFFFPATFFGFLLRHNFGRFISFSLSSLTWIATILISAYATELRIALDALVEKFTKII